MKTKQMGKQDYKNIRTLALHTDRLHTIKWIRTHIVNNFTIAKMIYEDVTTDKPWTCPRVRADINGVI